MLLFYDFDFTGFFWIMSVITTKLFLEDFKIPVDIGIHEFEINKPQRLNISVEVLLDENYLSSKDSIESTLNYDFIRIEIQKLVKTRRFSLQETLCRCILDTIICQNGVMQAKVITKKLDVYPDCGGVGVEMTYTA